MINFPEHTKNLKSTKEELEDFKKFTETHGDELEKMFEKLYELSDAIHEENNSRPFWVNLEIIMNGLHDCIEHQRIKEEGNNVL